MTSDETNDNRLVLYISPEHSCSYLPDREAQTIFLDPAAGKNPWLYQSLIERGFRRSGNMIYRPDCSGCRSCISVRLPVADFQPNRNQRRTWRRNSEIKVTVRSSDNALVYYPLFTDYQKQRHPGGEMSNTTEEQYLDFLTCDWLESVFLEFSIGDQLAAVAVTDVLPNGISAVYTFFDPALSRLSLGTCAILHQIEWAKRLNLRWLYLGYWLPNCEKMAYKNQFTPIQTFFDQQWQNHTKPPLFSDNILFSEEKSD